MPPTTPVKRVALEIHARTNVEPSGLRARRQHTMRTDNKWGCRRWDVLLDGGNDVSVAVKEPTGLSLPHPSEVKSQ